MGGIVAMLSGATDRAGVASAFPPRSWSAVFDRDQAVYRDLPTRV